MFPGAEGFRETRYATEYQILLFDHTGKEIHLDNSGKLEIPAMRPTLLDMRADFGTRFVLSAARSIRVAPSPGQVPRAGDLFSAGFVRWDLPGNFDNVHAHPAAPQQAIGRFNYSMPFLPLSGISCGVLHFQSGRRRVGRLLRVVDRMGRTARSGAISSARIRPCSSPWTGLKQFETPAEAFAVTALEQPRLMKLAMAAPS